MRIAAPSRAKRLATFNSLTDSHIFDDAIALNGTISLFQFPNGFSQHGCIFALCREEDVCFQFPNGFSRNRTSDQ